MNQDKLIEVLNFITNIQCSDEQKRLMLEMAASTITVDKLSELVKSDEQADKTNEVEIFKFTKQEILKMPKQFRKEFRTAGCTAHVLKRKNGKVELKRISINPMLKPYLDGVTDLKFVRLEAMRMKLKQILPNHKLYDLRTTFYTRCMECGVAEVAIKKFVGHMLGGLADTYTDLSDAFLLKESEKLNYK